MNGEMDCMEKWFWEAQTEHPRRSLVGATLFVDGFPCNQNESYIASFLRNHIPNVESVHVPMDEKGNTKSMAYV